MLPSLTDFLDRHYDFGPFGIEEQFQTNGHRLAYRAATNAGLCVVKLTDPGRPETTVRADVGTPAYLSEQGFPAPRPLAARDGRLYLPYKDGEGRRRFLYVYEYLPGGHPRPSDGFYRRLGGLLARLHSLPTGEVPESAYRPAEILAEVRERLLKVSDPEQCAVIPELLETIDAFPSFAALPRGIIHSDPYLVNLIEGPDGALALIDWEDGGVSYSLLDVGYALAYLCSFTARDRRLWGVPGPAEGLLHRPDWSAAFLSAYEAARPLTSAERALIPAAVQISFLVYIPNWGKDEIILENYRRMQMVLEAL